MYFTLVMTGSGKSLHAVASCWDEALLRFGKELGTELTDKATGRVSSMLLDEFDESPPWAYPHIARLSGYQHVTDSRSKKVVTSVGCIKVNLQVRASNSVVTEFYNRLGYSIEDRLSRGKHLRHEMKTALYIAAGFIVLGSAFYAGILLSHLNVLTRQSLATARVVIAVKPPDDPAKRMQLDTHCGESVAAYASEHEVKDLGSQNSFEHGYNSRLGKCFAILRSFFRPMRLAPIIQWNGIGS
jgi:hypothetical protein